MTKMNKRYKLEYEFINPFTALWTKGTNESEDLESLKKQRDAQLMNREVRNPKIFEQSVTEWREVND